MRNSALTSRNRLIRRVLRHSTFGVFMRSVWAQPAPAYADEARLPVARSESAPVQRAAPINQPVIARPVSPTAPGAPQPAARQAAPPAARPVPAGGPPASAPAVQRQPVSSSADQDWRRLQEIVRRHEAKRAAEAAAASGSAPTAESAAAQSPAAQPAPPPAAPVQRQPEQPAAAQQGNLSQPQIVPAELPPAAPKIEQAAAAAESAAEGLPTPASPPPGGGQPHPAVVIQRAALETPPTRQAAQVSTPEAPPAAPPASPPSAWQRLQRLVQRQPERQQPPQALPSSPVSGPPAEAAQPAPSLLGRIRSLFTRPAAPAPVQTSRQPAAPAAPATAAVDSLSRQAGISEPSAGLPAQTLPEPAPSAVTPAAPGAPAGEADPDWKRLQTILRKHSEKQQAEAQSGGVEQPTAPTGAIQRQPFPAAPGTPATPEGKRPPTAAAAGSVSAAEVRRPQRPAPLQRSQMQPAAKVSAPGAVSSPPPISGEAAQANLPAQPALPAAPASVEFLPAEPAPAAQVSAPVSEPQAAETGQPGLPDEPETYDPDQPLALETVWPVQRKIDQPAPAAKPVPASPAGEPAGRLAAPKGEQIHQVLQAVKPGQPSDSPVEVILPRSPRPAPGDKPAGEPRPSQSPANVLQAELESGYGAAPVLAPAAGVVPTEIGPLPEDLWRLIGQNPPAQGSGPRAGQLPAALPAAAPAVQRSLSQAPAQAQSAPLPAASPERTPPDLGGVTLLSQAPLEQAPVVIQRVESTPTRSAPTAGGEGAGDAGEAEGPDIDKLARQVYSEVRRMLAAERERTRGWK